jgi:hypothetical protein
MLTIFSGSRYIFGLIVGGAEPVRNEMISNKGSVSVEVKPFEVRLSPRRFYCCGYVY